MGPEPRRSADPVRRVRRPTLRRVGFGWLAERIGRLPTLLITIVLFVSMDIACLFAWSGASMMMFRFLQGIGTGGEVPVASAYINEFIGAKKRGRFFLLYELIFPIGLMFAGIAGYFLVPSSAGKRLFIVGLVPALLMIPLRILMPESPRWLASKGRIEKADKVVAMLENEAVKRANPVRTGARRDRDQSHREIRLARTVQRHLPQTDPDDLGPVDLRLHDQQRHDHLAAHPLQQVPPAPGDQPRLRLDHLAGGVLASVACALLIDKVGRKRWYRRVPARRALPVVTLTLRRLLRGPDPRRGHHRLRHPADHLVLPVLYSAELYPTRLRAIGTGFGSAWLRAGSAIGPLLVGFIVADLGIQYVFLVFAGALLVGAIMTAIRDRNQGQSARGTIAVVGGPPGPFPGRHLRAAAPRHAKPTASPRTILPWIGTGIRGPAEPKGLGLP